MPENKQCMTHTGFLVLGKVIKAHGLKGEIGIVSYADSPLIFNQLKRVYLQLPGHKHLRPYFICGCREHNNILLLELESLRTRHKARLCLGLHIYARKRDLPPKAYGEIYLQELTGFAVFLASGTRVGNIESANTEKGQEIWTIRTQGGQEILFPAAEPFVHDVLLDSKSVIIDPPPGLLDIYLQGH